MWGWWWLCTLPALVCLLLLLAAVAVKLWPAKPGTVWKVECQDCSWGADLSGTVSVLSIAALDLGHGHVLNSGHTVTAEEKGR